MTNEMSPEDELRALQARVDELRSALWRLTNERAIANCAQSLADARQDLARAQARLDAR